MVTGRQSCSEPTVKASTAAMSQAAVMTRMTGHGRSSAVGSSGGRGASFELITINVADPASRVNWVVFTP